MLKLEHLSLAYGEKTLLRDASLGIADGEHIAILGANGCGKSTLLRVLAGIPGAVKVGGSISIGGAPLASLSPAERAKRIALVPQDAVPDFPLRAEEYVMLGRTARLPRWAPPTAEDREAVSAALERTGAAGLAKAFVTELSGGERQRLAIALALATGAGTLLLDEPASHLDIRYRVMLTGLLDSLTGKTILMVLHDLDWARRCKRVLLFNGGTLDDGMPEKVLREDVMRRAFGIE